MQRSALAGFGPPVWLQGSCRSRPDLAASLPAPQTAGITECLLCFQEPPQPNYSVLLARLPFLNASFQFVPYESRSSQRPCPGPAVCQSCLRMRPTRRQLPAGSAPRQVFTFISPACASGCRGGQGQLGAGPQPGKVPWSGLVPSSSHQPWGVWSAEDSSAVPRGLPAVAFRRALVPGEREGGGDGGRDRGRSSWCRLRFELLEASKSKPKPEVETPPGSSAYASSIAAVPGIPT